MSLKAGGGRSSDKLCYRQPRLARLGHSSSVKRDYLMLLHSPYDRTHLMLLTQTLARASIVTNPDRTPDVLCIKTGCPRLAPIAHQLQAYLGILPPGAGA